MGVHISQNRKGFFGKPFMIIDNAGSFIQFKYENLLNVPRKQNTVIANRNGVDTSSWQGRDNGVTYTVGKYARGTTQAYF